MKIGDMGPCVGQKIAYVVVSGEYSSYQIRGVFTDPQLAKRFRGLIKDETRVEEFELDPAIPEHQEGEFAFEVHLFNRDRMPNGPDPGQVSANRCDPDEKGSYQAGSKYLIQRYCFIVWARDRNHAEKIGSEKRSRIMAAGMWGRPFEEVENI